MTVSRSARTAASAAALLALCLAATAAPALAGRKGKFPKVPERKGWRTEGMVVTDPSRFVNPDIVPLDDGRLRAYVMANGDVLSAVSTDGRTFTFDEGTRVNGQHHALVRLPDGRLRMYFSTMGPGESAGVRSAVSTDGLAFTVEEGTRLEPGAPGSPDALGLIHPHVVPLPEGGYRMYYDAQGEPTGGDSLGWKGIMSATSADGLVWTKDAGFRLAPDRRPAAWLTLVWSPFVEVEDGLYKLYCNGEHDSARRSGVYLALSRDGLSFTKVYRRPILHGHGRKRSGMGGPLTVPQDPFVVSVPGGKRLFYWLAEEGTASAFHAAP